MYGVKRKSIWLFATARHFSATQFFKITSITNNNREFVFIAGGTKHDPTLCFTYQKCQVQVLLGLHSLQRKCTCLQLVEKLCLQGFPSLCQIVLQRGEFLQNVCFPLFHFFLGEFFTSYPVFHNVLQVVKLVLHANSCTQNSQHRIHNTL